MAALAPNEALKDQRSRRHTVPEGLQAAPTRQPVAIVASTAHPAAAGRTHPGSLPGLGALGAGLCFGEPSLIGPPATGPAGVDAAISGSASDSRSQMIDNAISELRGACHVECLLNTRCIGPQRLDLQLTGKTTQALHRRMQERQDLADLSVNRLPNAVRKRRWVTFRKGAGRIGVLGRRPDLTVVSRFSVRCESGPQPTLRHAPEDFADADFTSLGAAAVYLTQHEQGPGPALQELIAKVQKAAGT